MGDTLNTIIIFIVIITAPLWIIVLGASLFFGADLLYLLPQVYGWFVYIVYAVVLAVIITLYILGHRVRSEEREIDFTIPSFVIKKGRG